MPNIFFISDTHFGDKEVLNFDKKTRPFKKIGYHDHTIIENWNKIVSPKDIVWHLGDVAFRKGSLRIIPKLNGIKKLILGNHDRYHISCYTKYFSQIYGSYKFKKDFLLTHFPIKVWRRENIKYNIHGHLHDHYNGPKLDKRYINVSAGYIKLTPISFDDILKSVNYYKRRNGNNDKRQNVNNGRVVLQDQTQEI